MKVESFVFYTSWLEAIEELNEEDQFPTLKAILRYQAYHIEPNIKGAAFAIFKMAQPIIDDMYSRRMASIENGKKGGRPKVTQSAETEDKVNGNKKPKQNLEKPSHNLEKPRPNLNENENDNDNGNENEKRVRFSPPSLEEVIDYCKERQNNVDPKKFYDYFSTGNWKDSKGEPVRNWKQKIITWEKYSPARQEEDKYPVYSEKNNITIPDEELNNILKELRRA